MAGNLAAALHSLYRCVPCSLADALCHVYMHTASSNIMQSEINMRLNLYNKVSSNKR